MTWIVIDAIFVVWIEGFAAPFFKSDFVVQHPKMDFSAYVLYVFFLYGWF